MSKADGWIATHMKNDREGHMIRTAFMMGARTALATSANEDWVELGDRIEAAARVYARVVSESTLRAVDIEDGFDSLLASSETGIFGLPRP